MIGLVLPEPGIPDTDFIEFIFDPFLFYCYYKVTYVPKFQTTTKYQTSNAFLHFHSKAIHLIQVLNIGLILLTYTFICTFLCLLKK